MNLSKLKETNTYIIIYATVMVIIVAFLLAFISSALKPTQDANVLRDTKNQILISLNITGLKGEAVDRKFAEVVTDTIQFDDKVVYQASVEGATKYVLPVKGRGLWGGLWGYISVDEDKQHVYGTYFDHESETAGLGARIKERWFQEQFNGKPIFTDNPQQVALTVVKKGQSKAETEIDGVTGATLTSNGVADMVTNGLQSYIGFLAGGQASVCKKPFNERCGRCKAGMACPEDESCEKESCTEVEQN